MKNLLIIPLLLIAVTASAQQYYNYTQYNRNVITYNPAFTGIEGYLDINGSWRKQWVGQTGNPEVFSLSAHGRLREDSRDRKTPPYSLRISDPDRYNDLASDTTWRENSPHAIGGYMIADRYEVNDYSLFLTYAYHLRVSSDWTLAAGAAIGAENTQLPDYLVRDQGDPRLTALRDNGETRFDFNLGLTFYSRRFFIGYGATQLSRKSLFDVQGETLDGTTFSSTLLSMKVHHMVNLGYRIRVAPTVEVYPNAQLRYVDGAPVSVDATLKGRFADVLMAGLTLRFDGNDNVAGAGMVGFTLDKWNFGYSYDYPFNDLKYTSAGSHEISVGLSLYKLYEHPAKFLW